MRPRVCCKKSTQAIENKRGERGKERKERKRVRKQLKTKGRQIGFATPTRSGQEGAQRHRAREQGYTPTIVGRPVATGSMRKVLRMEEILALRGAHDGSSSWHQQH